MLGQYAELSEAQLRAQGACERLLRPSTRGLVVFLGRQSQEGSNPNEESRQVSQIVNHPDYNSSTNDNDISLLKLRSPVTFTDYIRPVCLAAAGSTFFTGTDTWVTGWGTIGSGGLWMLSPWT